MKTNGKTAVALGFFDGLHVAHRRVLDAALRQKDAGLTPTVLLFDRHPYEVLTGRPVERLMTEDERRAALLDMGFALRTVSFAEIRDLEPEAFFSAYLSDGLRAGFVSCGYNYSFGRGGKGDVSLLDALCRAAGVALSVADPVTVGGAPVSSTAVRQALRDGDPRAAAAMLGRPFGFSAPVFSGDHRGRLLGTPTANQLLPEGLLQPKFGVYAAAVTLPDGRRFRAVTNIGCRPTFGGGTVRCESWLPDFSGDLYGLTLRTELLGFLRPERKFEDASALRAQIEQDARAARAVPDET